jgi:[phosphatase 2A protein]-leucine-carboxy methyltransferase
LEQGDFPSLIGVQLFGQGCFQEYGFIANSDTTGTYVRTIAIDRLVNQFLDDHDGNSLDHPPRKRQIISLGAGSDTRPFRLFASRSSSSIVYHELDFAVNTAAKLKAIRASPRLRRILEISDNGDSETIISASGDALHSPFYHLHPIDLRSLVFKTGVPNTGISIALPGIDVNLPTVLLSECCLIYLSPEQAMGVVDFFTKGLCPSGSTPTIPDPGTGSRSNTGTSAPPLGLIIYEPIRPDDPFGKTMVSNLAARGIQLQTLHKYSSLALQKTRMKNHGFEDGQKVADVDFIWKHWVSDAAKQRVAALEMLDEIEEWTLLAQHYCVAWGWRKGKENGNVDVFETWNNMESQQDT